MNTKVPSLKDQGKEYDGFTITITGDKYVCFPSVRVQTGAGACAEGSGMGGSTYWALG